MKILVTGGAGFIGSHIVQHFQGQADCVVLDNLRSGHRRNLDGLSCELLEGSIADRAAVRNAMEGVDYVFHLAAMVSVPESVERPHECVEANVIGLLNVLEEASRAGVKRLVFSSSAAVYGENPTTPKTEDLLPDPRSPYGITKLDGEYYCAMFSRAGRLETVALRYFNVFGPRQDPNSAYAAAVPIFINHALKGEPLTVYGDGLQTRDFIYVGDVVAANVFAAQQPGMSGVYNVGYGGEITILQLAQRIIAATGGESPIRHEPPRLGDIRNSRANVDRLHAAGFRPKSSLETGLARTVEFFRKQIARDPSPEQ